MNALHEYKELKAYNGGKYMVTVGQVLYDANEHEVVVSKVIENYIYATLKRKVRVTYNIGKVSEENVVTENISFSYSEIGIKYFYNIADYNSHNDLVIKDSRYELNRNLIIKFFRDKNLLKLQEILKHAPIGPILTDEIRDKIITSYYLEEEQLKEELTFHEKNPGCFGRIDMDTEFYIENLEKYHRENYYDVVYISKNVYKEIDDRHIVNWRAPIASLYYDTENTEMKSHYYVDVFNTITYINGRTPIDVGIPGIVYDYKLLLKRRYQNNPFAYRNLFIRDDLFFSEGSADSFLMNVIAEKRADHKLTDIIKTIQSNQNKMIRHTHKKNMIVQGCAGSGKTMILLHRLSYLKYNNLILNLDKAVIITPNDKFSLFINELAESLELERVKRITLSQYYLYLILEYQSTYPVYVPAAEKDSKNSKYIVRTNKKANDIVSNLQDSFNTNKKWDNINDLDVYYSKDFVSRIHQYYKSYMEKILEEIHYKDIYKIMERINIQIKTTDKISKVDLDRIYAYCNGLIIQNYDTLMSTAKKDLANIINESKYLLKKIDEFSNIIDNISKLKTIFMPFLKKNNELISQKECASKLVSRQDELLLKSKENESNRVIIEQEIDKLRSNISIHMKANLFIRLIHNKESIENKRLLSIFLEKQQLLIENISMVDRELSQLQSSINLMNKKILSLECEVEKEIEEKKFAKLHDFYSALNNFETKEAKVLIEKYKDAYNDSKIDVTIIKMENKDYSKKVNESIQQFCNQLDLLLKEAESKNNNFKCELNNVLSRETDAKHHLEYIQSVYPSEKEKQTLEDAAYYLTKRGMFVLDTYQSFMSLLKEENQKDYQKLADEKYALFILLYFYYLHCGSISSTYQYIFVDEGQDYSEEEYSLILKVNNEKCLFEIYGDINQCITINRGITNWKSLKTMFDADYYELNENYRNTVEIAKYINDKLQSSFYSIGIHGPAVKNINFNDLLFSLESECVKNSQYRVAVICKDNLLLEQIKEKMSPIERKKVMFDDVFGIKGLEFEVVYVINKNMDRNESYIAFSRALNKLYTVTI